MIDVVEKVYRFGDIEVDIATREMTRAGETVLLNAKTFDLLQVLVENRGKILSKDELLEIVWPGQFVEENNLTVQMSTLRKALGNGKPVIKTIPGKGYSFVADVTTVNDPTDVVVESHEISRIVVEEFSPTSELSSERRLVAKPRSKSVAIYLVAASMLIATLAGAFYLWSSGAFALNGFYENLTMRQLTTSGNVGMAALSPDGKLFAYTIDELGKKSLWLGYVDGGNHIQLREAAEAVYRSLTFSPDGKFLIYSLRDDKNPKPTLMKMPVLGGLQEKVLDDIGTFSLSPDGREIAVTRPAKDDETKTSVSIASIDGTTPRDIASFDKSQWFLAAALSWSKDKSKLATALISEDESFHTELAIIDIATGSIETISHEMLREVTKTAWLADGSALIVTAVELNSYSSVPHYLIFQIDYPSGAVHRITNDRSQYGESWHSDGGVTISLADSSEALLAVEHRQVNNIWIAAADNLRDQRQITFGSFGKYDGLWGLDWTPDGKLVFTTSDTESQFIAQMNPDGSDRKQITASGKVDSSLSVTADGRHIIFHSNRAPDFSIWRSDIDGANAKQLTFGKYAYQPTSTADGKWVYYNSHIGGKNGFLCRVPFDGGEEECFTDKETSTPSSSPDGRFIAAAYRTDKTRIAIFSTDDHRIIRQIDIPKNATSFIGIRWTHDSRAFTLRDAFSGYWMFPVEGEPYKLEGLPDERLYNFSWSRDGKWLAFVRGQEIRDVVIFNK